MLIDQTKDYIVYPSWAHFSYRWEDLPALFSDPLETKYLRRHTYNWSELGYSSVTDNYQLFSGPFGNGIVCRDNSRMADAKNDHCWLPGVLLRAESRYVNPIGSRIQKVNYRTSYLSPKPSDDVLMGFKREKDDPMPYFSAEPVAGMENIAFVCLATTRLKNIPVDFKELTLCLRIFGFKAEFLGDELPENRELVEIFLRKWNLSGFWFFVDSKGQDCGMLLASLVYLGSHFKQKNPRLKSIHIMTTLGDGYEPMCSKWTMQKLR